MEFLGPLVSPAAVQRFTGAVSRLRGEGAEVLHGGGCLQRSGCCVAPTLVWVEHPGAMMNQETFAPLLQVVPYEGLDEAIGMNNAVPQGLSSALSIDSLRHAERFLS
jgi:aldehyde dehydrogenase (NAD+)